MSQCRADRRRPLSGAWLMIGLVCASILGACASPQVVPAATVALRPGIERPAEDRLQARMPDGTRLPLRRKIFSARTLDTIMPIFTS